VGHGDGAGPCVPARRGRQPGPWPQPECGGQALSISPNSRKTRSTRWPARTSGGRRPGRTAWPPAGLGCPAAQAQPSARKMGQPILALHSAWSGVSPGRARKTRAAARRCWSCGRWHRSRAFSQRLTLRWVMREKPPTVSAGCHQVVSAFPTGQSTEDRALDRPRKGMNVWAH
jgi:hypothetical protein